ncbi:MAG: hypothetical protein AAF974_04240 [Cyanobacteria bacterium P01_E01_bin.34]
MKLPVEHREVRHELQDLLSCRQFDMLYDSPSYWVVREQTGHVALSKLVTVEMYLDSKASGEIELTCVAKNQELPLQEVNHCQQVFETVRAALHEFQASVLESLLVT